MARDDAGSSIFEAIATDAEAVASEWLARCPPGSSRPSPADAVAAVRDLAAAARDDGEALARTIGDLARRVHSEGAGLSDVLDLADGLAAVAVERAEGADLSAGDDAARLHGDDAARLHAVLRRALCAAAVAHRDAAATDRAERIELVHRSLRSLAHEMKNVLSGGVAVTQLLERSVSPAMLPELVARLNGVFSRLDTLAEDTTNMALTQRSQDDAAGTISPLPKLVESLLDDLRDLAARGRVSLHVDGELPDVPIDTAHASIALSQLIADAIRYSDARATQGWVTVGARVEDDVLTIAVEDDGTGLPEGVHERLFDPAFRPTEEHGVRGSRVSLGLAREAIAQIGGSVRCEPRSGGGRRLVVELPSRRSPSVARHSTDPVE